MSAFNDNATSSLLDKNGNYDTPRQTLVFVVLPCPPTTVHTACCVADQPLISRMSLRIRAISLLCLPHLIVNAYFSSSTCQQTKGNPFHERAVDAPHAILEAWPCRRRKRPRLADLRCCSHNLVEPARPHVLGRKKAGRQAYQQVSPRRSCLANQGPTQSRTNTHGIAIPAKTANTCQTHRFPNRFDISQILITALVGSF